MTAGENEARLRNPSYEALSKCLTEQRAGFSSGEALAAGNTLCISKDNDEAWRKRSRCESGRAAWLRMKRTKKTGRVPKNGMQPVLQIG